MSSAEAPAGTGIVISPARPRISYASPAVNIKATWSVNLSIASQTWRSSSVSALAGPVPRASPIFPDLAVELRFGAGWTGPPGVADLDVGGRPAELRVESGQLDLAVRIP